VKQKAAGISAQIHFWALQESDQGPGTMSQNGDVFFGHLKSLNASMIHVPRFSATFTRPEKTWKQKMQKTHLTIFCETIFSLSLL
jgi:hypothetical protein